MSGENTHKDQPVEFTEKQKALIRMLADGTTIDDCIQVMVSDPYLVDPKIIADWMRNADILKEVIRLSNDIIGQAWGTMWYSIKKKAMLGSVQHSKMLIEFVQNNNRLPDSRLQLIFDDVVAGGDDNTTEGTTDEH